MRRGRRTLSCQSSRIGSVRSGSSRKRRSGWIVAQAARVELRFRGCCGLRGYCLTRTASPATSRDLFGNCPGMLLRPERLFPLFQRPWRKPVSLPSRISVIRAIVLSDGRGATMRECKAGSGSFAVEICPIAVPPGRGAPDFPRKGITAVSNPITSNTIDVSTDHRIVNR